jgi:hypothetical protein
MFILRFALKYFRRVCSGDKSQSGAPGEQGEKLSMALNRAASRKDRPVAFQHGEPTQRSDSDCINLSGPDTHRYQGANVTSQRGVVRCGSMHWMAEGWFTAVVIYPLGML